MGVEVTCLGPSRLVTPSPLPVWVSLPLSGEP